MEFFASLDLPWTAEALQRDVDIAALPALCASIDTLLDVDGDRGRIYCVWGEFEVRRELIRGGLRFSLTTCPNALAWTITTGLPPEPGHTVIHCTINRTRQEPDFVESIERFVADWRDGLRARASGPRIARRP